MKRTVDGESTIHVEVLDCQDNSVRFPSVAFYKNLALDEEYAAASNELKDAPDVVEIRGYAPDTFLAKLKEHCVRLDGGSYLGMKTSSAVVRITP